jgi:MFS family permease
VGIILPIMPLYARELGASGLTLGVIFSSYAFTMAILNPVIGGVADRVGYKRIIALGLAIHVPVALLFVAATRPSHLILIRLAEGALSAMVNTVAMAYAGSIAPKNREGSVMGFFNTFMFMGFGAGPLIGGYLAARFGMNAPFYVMAGVLAGALVPVLLLLPEQEGRLTRQQEKGQTHLRALTGQALGSGIMKGILIYSLILSLGDSGLMAFLPLITSREHLSTTEIGLLTSSLMICTGALQTPFGFLANRLNKVFLVISGVVLVGIVLAFVPSCTGFMGFFVLSLLGGLGTAMSQPAATAMVVVGGKDVGLGFAMGLYNLAMGLGMIAGPVMSGMVMDLFGLDHIFYASSVIFFIAAGVIYGLTRGVKGL